MGYDSGCCSGAELMEFETMMMLVRRGKVIAIMLKEGTELTLENIYDIEVATISNELEDEPE